jgi:hypothetical protein
VAGTAGLPVVQAEVDPFDPPAESEGFEAFYLREDQAVVQLADALSGSRLPGPESSERPPVPSP